ncbi:MAG: response regulator transcription factor [Lachnospiraceae bacterium]|nr:response regulator transcription factor [Lachnospiraceae bacterium]
MSNILICDDEKDIVEALKIYLSDPDWVLFSASTGQEALDILAREEIHLVLLDIMMPEMDGLTALARIRQQSNVPVLLLTAKSQETDIILGLNVGADDYITKPFAPLEVVARARAALRRYLQLGSGAPEPDSLKNRGLSLNKKTKEVLLDGEAVNLTPREFEILALLMQHPGQVFSPREIYEQVWGEKPYGAENTVAVHIRHLREKIEIDPARPRMLKVIFGQGYKMEKE